MLWKARIGVHITGEMIKEACNCSKKRIFLLKNVVYFVNLDSHCVYCSISVRSRTVLERSVGKPFYTTTVFKKPQFLLPYLIYPMHHEPNSALNRGTSRKTKRLEPDG